MLQSLLCKLCHKGGEVKPLWMISSTNLQRSSGSKSASGNNSERINPVGFSMVRCLAITLPFFIPLFNSSTITSLVLIKQMQYDLPLLNKNKSILIETKSKTMPTIVTTNVDIGKRKAIEPSEDEITKISRLNKL